MRLQCFFSSVRANMKLYHSECDYEQCQRLYMLESLKLLYGYLCCMFCSKSHTNLTLEECPCSLEMQSAAASHINVSSSDLKWKSSWWTARFSWQVASIRYESPHTYKISIINWSSTENTRKERTLDRSLHLSGDAKGVIRWVYSWAPTPLISSRAIMGPIMLWPLISFNTNFRGKSVLTTRSWGWNL